MKQNYLLATYEHLAIFWSGRLPHSTRELQRRRDSGVTARVGNGARGRQRRQASVRRARVLADGRRDSVLRRRPHVHAGGRRRIARMSGARACGRTGDGARAGTQSLRGRQAVERREGTASGPRPGHCRPERGRRPELEAECHRLTVRLPLRCARRALTSRRVLRSRRPRDDPASSSGGRGRGAKRVRQRARGARRDAARTRTPSSSAHGGRTRRRRRVQ